MTRRVFGALSERWALVLLAHVLASYVCLITTVLVFEPRKIGAYLLPVLAAPVSVPVALVVVTVAATVKGIIFCWAAYSMPFGAVLMMRRRLGKVGAYHAFTAAAAVAIALVVGLAVSGVRSFRSATDAAVDFGYWSFYVQSLRAEVTFTVGVADRSYGVNGGADDVPIPWADRGRERTSRIVDKRFSGLGFSVHTGDPSRRHPNGLWLPVRLTAPDWFFLLVMVLVGWWILRQQGKWLRRERRERGLCEACGYDLRESTERCPECGTEILARLWLLFVTRVKRLCFGGIGWGLRWLEAAWTGGTKT
jgi:hypothetical protein